MADQQEHQSRTPRRDRWIRRVIRLTAIGLGSLALSGSVGCAAAGEAGDWFHAMVSNAEHQSDGFLSRVFSGAPPHGSIADR